MDLKSGMLGRAEPVTALAVPRPGSRSWLLNSPLLLLLLQATGLQVMGPRAMPYVVPSKLPGQPRTLCTDVKTKMGLAPRVLDSRMRRWWVQPVQVCGRFYSGWRNLLTGSDAAIFLSSCCGRRCPASSFLLASTGPSKMRICSPASPLLDLKGLLLPKWTRCPRVTLFTAADWAHVRIFGLVLACSCLLLASSGCLSLCPRLASP